MIISPFVAVKFGGGAFVEHFCEQSQHAVNHARLIGRFNLMLQRELICIYSPNYGLGFRAASEIA
jgi:hypothetical protein